MALQFEESHEFKIGRGAAYKSRSNRRRAMRWEKALKLRDRFDAGQQTDRKWRISITKE